MNDETKKCDGCGLEFDWWSDSLTDHCRALKSVTARAVALTAAVAAQEGLNISLMHERERLDREAGEQALRAVADGWEAVQGTGPKSDAPWLGDYLRGCADDLRKRGVAK